VRRALVLVAALCVLVAAAVPSSGASFTGRQSSIGSTVRADSPANYLHLYSQSTDPAGLTGYADKRLSSPAVKAATGSDLTLKLALGNYRNGGTMNRAFTIQAAGTLPASPLTVALSVSVPSAGWSGTPATIANVGSTGGSATATLTANTKRQVNITIPALPRQGVLYTGTLTVKVTYPGYTGTFLTYTVPISVYDGTTGGGP
jgi:hypothetical protein